MTKTLIISEKIWQRGAGDAKLLNEAGKMCCLGFLCTLCGLSKNKILDKLYPQEVDKNFYIRMKFKKAHFGWWEAKTLEINDSIYIDDKIRKRELKKHFKLIGVNIKYVA